jgi:hypothetical protein
MTNNSSFAAIPAGREHGDALKDTTKEQIWLLNVSHTSLKRCERHQRSNNFFE